jgi:tol-pal system beta propeller repeat protein TolB
VLAGGGSVSEAAFPGKQGKIAFFCDYGECDQETEYGVHIANPDGSGRRYVGVESGAPDWSADGKRLLLRTNAGIEVANAEGGNRTLVVPHPVNHPAWSPDGTQIVFARLSPPRVTTRTWDIHVVDADGSNANALTNGEGDSLSPEWSPDGTKIVFASNRDGDYEIYVMNADGSDPVALTANTNDDLHPDWSPDGKRIAFDRDGSSRNGLEEIFVMNADGSAQRQITRTSRWSWMPAWSPNGKRIVFERNEQLTIMHADGSNLVTLPFWGDGMSPDWQPRPR